MRDGTVPHHIPAAFHKPDAVDVVLGGSASVDPLPASVFPTVNAHLTKSDNLLHHSEKFHSVVTVLNIFV